MQQTKISLTSIEVTTPSRLYNLSAYCVSGDVKPSPINQPVT